MEFRVQQLSRTAHYLKDLERGHLERGHGASTEPRSSEGDTNVIALYLPDLVADDTGSIIIETGGDLLVIEIMGYRDVVKRGIAPDGTWSQHQDVSGLDYCQFTNGKRIFYSADKVRLILAPN